MIDAQTEYSSKIIPNTEQLSTLIYDDYSLDTVGERPLGLFLRSYSPLNVTAQPDPLNGDNQVVMFKDEHPQYHYGMQYFDPQSSYVVAGTSVMPAQTNAAFSFSVMRAGVYPVESGVANNCAAKIIFGLDGNIYGDKNKQFNLMPYQANQWYDIQAKIRLNEGTYDVYINGTKMAENIPLCDTTVKQVNQIVFDTSDATTNSDSAMGTFYIDNSIVKAPASPGKNQYLMSLKINGSEVDGFEPAKEFYYVNMSADELQSANIEYTAGNNAYVKVWDIDGGKCVTVVSADKMNTSSYVIKAQ